MADIIARHRPLALLACLIIVQLMLLAFQVKREHNVTLVRYWAVQAFTPVERAGTWSFSKARGFWNGYIGLRDTRDENQRLKTEVDQLRMRNRELESKAAEAQRLAVVLNFREAHPEAPMLAAEVIGASADPTSHTLFINRGERDHMRRNLAVITPDGIVGKIVEVFPSAAQVLLINDKESGVGALLEASRAHGVIKGTGDVEPRMEYVENGEKVQPGDIILTSGEDRIYPKGLPIGTVESAAQSSPFQSIRVRPAARLDRLEEVLVLMSQQEISFKRAAEQASTAAPASPAAKQPAPATAPPPKTVTPRPAATPVVPKPKPPAVAPAPSTPAPSAPDNTAPAPAPPANPAVSPQ
jgi:rod shape-determining protein MreC